MPQKAQVEINQFIGGFTSDASPLTYPPNTSFVDINMELNTDGSRQRALGMDYEETAVEVTTTISSADSISVGFNTYRWENVGGDPEKIIICVQFGNEVKFFNSDSIPLSDGLIDTHLFTSSSTTQRFSFSSVDGNLVVATGISDITIIVYDSGSLTYSTDNIKVRDFFGVEDLDGSDDLTVGTGLQIRPTTLSDAHQYNLRNQSYGVPRVNGNSETIQDPILSFYNTHNSIKGSGKYPSNSDAVTPFLYADANDGDDRNSRRYFSKDNIRNPLGNSQSAQGYYIIDILNRGTSRVSEDTKNHTNYSELNYTITSLPTDSTPGGATVLGEFAGRIWYGGFSGTVVDGDSKSPQLSSYIAFSQLVTDPSMITQCYQAGDPTSDTEPDIIDTDGGYIRLNNAYGINTFINLGKNLIVGSKNGIWRIFGGNDSGFSATNYVVEKITDKGIRGTNSAVQVENTLVYWSDDGIYWLKQNQFGDWISENQTQGRIQKFYNEIPVQDKERCVGVYDSYQRKVRWLYQNSMTTVQQQKELVFDINLNAFYERHISQINGSDIPLVIGSFNTNVFKINTNESNVVAGSDLVLVGGEQVVVTISSRASENSLFEVGYVVVTQITPVVKYTFGVYNNTDFLDWYSYDNVGVDAPATLITGSASGGDNMRYKQVPYLYVHLKRTEDGFEEDVNGDLVPIDQSSCSIRSLWDWTNSSNSNKWSSAFQAYRYKRAYFPADINDMFDTGYETIVTKNKLRGRGRSLSLEFTSSPGKEMHIYGWSLQMTVNDNA